MKMKINFFKKIFFIQNNLKTWFKKTLMKSQYKIIAYNENKSPKLEIKYLLCNTSITAYIYKYKPHTSKSKFTTTKTTKHTYY